MEKLHVFMGPRNIFLGHPIQTNGYTNGRMDGWTNVYLMYMMRIDQMIEMYLKKTKFQHPNKEGYIGFSRR